MISYPILKQQRSALRTGGTDPSPAWPTRAIPGPWWVLDAAVSSPARWLVTTRRPVTATFAGPTYSAPTAW